MFLIIAGRYGDPLNPWGDLIAISQAWCVSTPNAMLAMGVPYVKTGDRIEYNAHRVYGPLMYPFLVTNWVAHWVEDGEYSTAGYYHYLVLYLLEYKRTAAEALYQPYFVFKKQ